jgi:SAM-dependent methyltransferase
MSYFTRYWAVERCKAFFGLTDEDARRLHGDAGLLVIRHLWDTLAPAAFYAHPWVILRQEIWHAAQDHRRYQHAGFWPALQGGVLLDVGCGTAELARLPWILRDQAYIGVEPSPACRAYLVDKYAGARVDIRPALPAGPVDGLLCVDVLEHVPDPLTLMAAMWQRLRLGGHALLRFDDAYPHPGHLEEAIAQIPAWWEWLRAHGELVELETFLWVKKIA